MATINQARADYWGGIRLHEDDPERAALMYESAWRIASKSRALFAPYLRDLAKFACDSLPRTSNIGRIQRLMKG